MRSDSVDARRLRPTWLVVSLSFVCLLQAFAVGAGANASVATRIPVPKGSPRIAQLEIAAIACESPGTCTAGGTFYPRRGLSTGFPAIADEVQGTWRFDTRLSLPRDAVGGAVHGISCVSRICTAVGDYFVHGAGVAFAALGHSGRWGPADRLPTPVGAAPGSDDFSMLNSVACSSERRCVAVGTYTKSGATLSQQAFTATDVSGRWSALEARMPAAESTDGVLLAIACAPGGSVCAAVGFARNSHGGNGSVAISYQQGSWSTAVRVRTPRNGIAADTTQAATRLDAVSCTSRTTCVAGGGYYTREGGEGFLVTRRDGVWQAPYEAKLPPNASKQGYAVITSVACSLATYCQAGGTYFANADKDGGLPVWFLYRSGTWSAGALVQLPRAALPSTEQMATVTAAACSIANTCELVGTYVYEAGPLYPGFASYSLASFGVQEPT